MARLPKYMKVKKIEFDEKSNLFRAKVTIKWWYLPIIYIK